MSANESETKGERNSESGAEENDPLGLSQGPSPLAQNLSRLRESTLRVVRNRERLPQPLFWSLFHAQVSEIRKKRAHERELRRILYGIEI